MAEFKPAFDKMILDEGGFKLHNVAGDRGGLTYAGIARNFNPSWPGWAYIDRGETPPSQLVYDFYRDAYWAPVRGDELPQRIAETIFNFAINSSAPFKPLVAVKLAQVVIGATPDGVLGPRSIAVLKTYDEDLFVARYALVKVARYRDIVTRDRSQQKFLLGWINRTLKGVSS
jgi:lysozyme family protein